MQSANAAIERGCVDEWRALGAEAQEYSALSALVGKLRDVGLIPRPRASGDEPQAWKFRKPLEVNAFRRAVDIGKRNNDDGRAAFLLHVAQEPYVPGTREQALSVQAAWQSGDVETVEVAA